MRAVNARFFKNGGVGEEEARRRSTRSTTNPCEAHPKPSLLLQMAALLPMLVVFLAVLQGFFLDCLASYVPERAIVFEFPISPEQSRIGDPDTLSIDIHADGSVSIAGVLSERSDSSDLPLLRQHLRSVRDTVNQHGGLVVRPDSNVRFQRLIDVISAVRSSGISFFGLT